MTFVQTLRHNFTVALWKLSQGDQSLRLNYALTPESVVFDLGGYVGEWSDQIMNRYNPTIYIFEPVEEYYNALTLRFANNPTVHVFKFGLSNKNQITRLSLDADASSAYMPSETSIPVELKEAKPFFTEHKIGEIDLMKINIEGGEYDLLDHLIHTKKTLEITNIQVQFHHFVPNAAIRRNRIRQLLSKTHTNTYCFPFVWENWRRKH